MPKTYNPTTPFRRQGKTKCPKHNPTTPFPQQRMQGVLDDFSRASKGVAKNPKIPIWWGRPFFVPGPKILQIIMLFLSPAQKCYKLQCFFCPRLKNATNYNAFLIPCSKMLQITMLFLSPAQTCCKL